MKLLIAIARDESVLIVSLLFLAVVAQALTGRIRLEGIFQDKITGRFDAGRAQLLISTLVLGGLMLAQLDHMRMSRVVEMPSSMLLYVLGGSHGLYLTRKVLQVRALSKGE